jgi:uncharacterized protein (TIGR00266 family)
MRYKIIGETLPAVSLTLDSGESIYTQSGGMTWMSEGFQMDTNMKGGLSKGFGRMFAGESLFMATYTSTRPNSEICCASSFPGSIIPLEITPDKEYICQKGAFLCAQPGVKLSATTTKSFGGGLFGGEGFILQRLSGQGTTFLELDGTIVEKQLQPNEIIKVDTGNVACFEASVSYELERIKGFKNIFFGGEGLFLTVLRGPGKVWLQTINISGVAGRLAPFFHKNAD